MSVDVEDHLQTMSERLESEITAAVRRVLENSKYFQPESLDKLVSPIAAWACGLPYEAHEKGYIALDAPGDVAKKGKQVIKCGAENRVDNLHYQEIID
jgi:hypothetical protein